MAKGYKASHVMQCFGKERFASAAQAQRAAHYMRRKVKMIEAYQCPHCGGYHVGKPRQGRR